MAKKDHSFKWKKKKAKAYKKALKAVFEVCNELLITEDKLCYHLMTGKASDYVNYYREERVSYAQEQLEKCNKF